MIGDTVIADLGNDMPDVVTIKHTKGKYFIVEDVLGNRHTIHERKIRGK